MAPCVIVASGGCSVPQTGSTGDGHTWARAAGHTITELYPTEVPIVASDWYITEKLLQGLSLREVQLTLFDPNGKKVTTQEGDLIFTHFGLSGPAVLRMGHYVSVTQRKYGQVPLKLTIDMMPERTADEIFSESWQRLEEQPKKSVKNALKGYLPERLIPLLLQLAEIPEETIFHQMPKRQWQLFSQIVKNVPVTVTGTLSLEEAFITGGGVSIKEIDPKTMQSKLINGLFFAGEVMDVHAHTGGYNITIAFSSGYVAGYHSALAALDPS
jgi:predicted Rossmann fold flavoprotein